ncbi:MAG: hypothetical protein ABIA12_01665 [Candidatus Aenigmatarchaeota archaeon]
MDYLAEGGFLFAPDSTEMTLAECGGSVVPYGNRRAVFEMPLMKTEGRPSTRAYSSGMRSALLRLGGSWYKIKGVAPTDVPYDCGDTPVGGQKIDDAGRELYAASAMADYGTGRGVLMPIEPVCMFDYDRKFMGNKVCASVLKVHGDIRLVNVFSMFSDSMISLYRQGVRESEELREMANRVGEFLGFWYGGLEHADLCWGTLFPGESEMVRHTFMSNAGPHNISFYKTPGGIGACMVDLDMSCAKTDRKTDLEVEKMHHSLKALEGALHFLEHGRDEKSIMIWVFENWWKSMTSKSPFRKGYDPYDGVPKPEDFESLDRFERCRRGSLPRPIDAGTFYDVIGAQL